MPVTIREIIIKLSQGISGISETPALDAQVLVAHCLDRPRSWVMAHPEIELDEHQNSNITRGYTRLLKGEPLPYVIGHWEFYGLDFTLTPDVLIPRPETELLVEQATSWLHTHPGRNNSVDVGTGSGCIGISLAINNPGLRILLTDISQTALDVASVNIKKYGLEQQVELQQADLLGGILRQFDLICANLPYIPNLALMELSVADREPRIALDGGESGTALISKLLEQSRSLLAPGGLMLLEIEQSQGEQVRSIATKLYPAAQIEILKDLAGRDRCLKLQSSDLLVHLCRREDWLAARAHGSYRSPSIEQEGFIHCSMPQQILTVANRFYQGSSGLVLLWINPATVTARIEWEATDAALFPHIYGHIDLDAVQFVTDFLPDDDGVFRKLQLPA
jgi:release factor glutamine methyltransferase